MKKLLVLITIFSLFSSYAVVWANEPLTLAIEDCLSTPNSDGCRAGLPAAHYQILLDEMLMMPEPPVQHLPLNDREMTRYAYRRLTNPAGTTIYNAPNGAPVGGIDAGFTYVTVYELRDGWVRIDEGQWVRENETAVTRPSTHRGVLLPAEGLEYTMAWVLTPVHPAPYPGAAQDTSLTRLERYDRVTIFEEVEVDGWRWYLVAPDTWIRQTNVAKIVETERPENVKGYWMAIDLYEQVLVAYEEDTPVFATLISSGLPQWATREGTFETYWRLTNGYMTGAEGQSDYYLVDGVPYTLYFDESISLHGTYWHDDFGYRHSHGCVNMTITDAHWVFDWSANGGFDYPFIHVFSSGVYVNG